MKLTKANYLAYFFTLCFVALLGLNIYRNFNRSVHTWFAQSYSVSLPTNDNDVSGGMDITLEETETEKETEKDSDLADLAFILPKLLYVFEQKVIHHFLAHTLAESTSNPIYMLVHNYRI